jgi:hypothetical protein
LSLYTERLSRYRAKAESCNACPLKPECTPGASGRVLMRRASRRSS